MNCPKGLSRSFWNRVHINESGCWLWKGSKDKAGYGFYGVSYAHRHVYATLVGRLPSGKKTVIDHKCNVPSCCNPEHLQKISQRNNIMRSATAVCSIKARQTHCDRGHKFDKRNTIVSRSRDRAHPYRRCRTCARAWWAAYNKRKRDEKLLTETPTQPDRTKGR